MAQSNHRILERGKEWYVMMKTECQSYVTDVKVKIRYDAGSEDTERAHEAMNTGSP